MYKIWDTYSFAELRNKCIAITRGPYFIIVLKHTIKEEVFLMGDKNPKKKEKKKKKVERIIPAQAPKTEPAKKPK